MYTSIQLKDFLKEISEEARFIKFEYDSPEKFNVLIKCKVEENQSAKYYKEHAKNWIKQFSYFTKTTWLVRTCYPRVKCFVFRKTYGCPLGASTAKRQARNMDCKANINFKITNNGNDAVVKDPHFQEGLNMTIAIECEHTHSLKINSKESCNTQKVGCYSKSTFYDLFDEGYTPMAASCYHVLRLMDMYGPDSEKLADCNFNPTIQRIQYLFSRQWNRNEINVNEVMNKKMQTLEKIGHTIRYSIKPSYFIILTPLMKRVITQIGSQRVLIDATLEHGAPFTLVLYVPSMIGSLPVACATFTEVTEGIYLQIFLTVKIAIQTLTGINFDPKVLLHDDDLMIKEALSLVFPKSIIILNRYSLCRDFWRWICDDSTAIKPEPLTTIFVLFKSLVFTKSLNESKLVHDNLISRSLPGKCLDKIHFIWVNRKQWIDDNQLCDGFNDALINFTKEFILELCKPFNGILPAMLDIITNVIESHYNKILLAHRDGNVMSVYAKFIAKTKIDINSEYVRKVDSDEYHIQDGLNRGQVQQIDIDTMCCDCSDGKIGRMCEHLCALLILNDDKFALFSSLDYNERNIFLKILGDTSTTMSENINDLQIEETAIDDERSKSCLSSQGSEENNNRKIKKEVQDSLETNHEDENIGHDRSIKMEMKMKMEDQDSSETYDEDENSVSIQCASEDTSKKELKEQYEACMNCVSKEFQRLEKLFKEHPNETNLYTMQRLAKELAKVVVVKEEVDLSNMFVTLNNQTSVTEEI